MAKIISKTITCTFCGSPKAKFVKTETMEFKRLIDNKMDEVNWYKCNCTQEKFFRFVKLDSNVSRETSKKLKK